MRICIIIFIIEDRKVKIFDILALQYGNMFSLYYSNVGYYGLQKQCFALFVTWHDVLPNFFYDVITDILWFIETMQPVFTLKRNDYAIDDLIIALRWQMLSELNYLYH